MELVGELFDSLAEEKGLELNIDLKPDVPNKLIGDPFRLRQVITNLVSNAVKFTEKGRIVIGATLMESYKSQVNILFTVEDTGIGIPRDRIKEIFGSYTQARGSVTRKFGGTGLGTTIAKQLVELDARRDLGGKSIFHHHGRGISRLKVQFYHRCLFQ